MTNLNSPATVPGKLITEAEANSMVSEPWVGSVSVGGLPQTTTSESIRDAAMCSKPSVTWRAGLVLARLVAPNGVLGVWLTKLRKVVRDESARQDDEG
jgi:hypothetical protein